MKRGLFIKLEKEDKTKLLSITLKNKIVGIKDYMINELVNAIPTDNQLNITQIGQTELFELWDKDSKRFSYKLDKNWGYCLMEYKDRPENRQHQLFVYVGK